MIIRKKNSRKKILRKMPIMKKKEGNNNESPESFKKEGKSNLFGSQNVISYMNEGLKVPKKEREIKAKEDKQDQIILNQIKTKMIMWCEKVKKEKEQFRAEKVILSRQKESFQQKSRKKKKTLQNKKNYCKRK